MPPKKIIKSQPEQLRQTRSARARPPEPSSESEKDFSDSGDSPYDDDAEDHDDDDDDEDKAESGKRKRGTKPPSAKSSVKAKAKAGSLKDSDLSMAMKNRISGPSSSKETLELPPQPQRPMLASTGVPPPQLVSPSLVTRPPPRFDISSPLGSSTFTSPAINSVISAHGK